MKKWMALPVLAAVFVSCIGTGRLIASPLTIKSNYSVNGEPVICDNLTTKISYGFGYAGDLKEFSSEFVSTRDANATGGALLTKPSDAYGYTTGATSGNINITLELAGSKSVPQTEGSISTQGITVSPPAPPPTATPTKIDPAGYYPIQLRLTVYDSTDNSATTTSEKITVGFCS